MILHLVAKAEWDAIPADQPYLPQAFARDGFIHCTQGDDMMLQVANRFYKSAPGNFVVLSIDEGKVKATVKWEPAAPPAAQPAATVAPTTPPAAQPAAEMPPEAKVEFGSTASPAETPGAAAPAPAPVGAPAFPHIYGPLNRDAIVAIRRAVRASDGSFTGFVSLDTATGGPAGMNLKTPSQLAGELLDATGEFSDALARYKDHIEARMDELDKNIKDKLP